MAQNLLATAPAGSDLLVKTLLTTQFAYVYDHPSRALLFVSAGVERLLGERPDAATLTLDWFAERLHPADAAAVADAQALVQHYLREREYTALPSFMFSLDYRLRHADGRYRRVLHQHLLLEREPGPGPVRRTLALFTDLTHHKLTHEVRMHVNQPDFAAFAAQHRPAAPVLTARERQVLALVLDGLTSRQIAYQLRLGENTVRAHRRNLLRKTGTRSLHSLLGHLTSGSV
jgi:DNA-binding CsgD family transcriptional regulator